MQDLSNWIGMFSLYRGSDPFMNMACAPEREMLANWLKSHNRNHGDIHRHDNGGCWVCGQTNYAHAVIAARFEGDSSRPVEIIEVGHICAEQLGMDSMERSYFKEGQRLQRRALADEFIESMDLKKVFDKLDTAGGLGDWGNSVAADIRGYIFRKGFASERQVALLHKIYKDQLAYELRIEERKKEQAPRVPAPVGRETVTGKIVKIKEKYTDYGVTLKMTVVCEGEGGEFMVWGSVPKMPTYAEVGDEIKFTATFTQSDDDPSFAFFKRPAKGEFINGID